MACRHMEARTEAVSRNELRLRLQVFHYVFSLNEEVTE